MAQTESVKPIHMFQNGHQGEGRISLIVEEPLSIRVDGEPYAVVMRTPGREIHHVAGFCLAEGLIDSPADTVTVGFCPETGGNVVTVTLTADRRQKVADLLQRKGFISQTSCGICGKEVVQDMFQIITPLAETVRFTAGQLLSTVASFPLHQPLYQNTRSAHAAMVFDADMNRLAVAEDVGRHNALDKAVGQVFMDHRLAAAKLGIMSSRLSYELVQKAARAQLEVLVGLSHPTALAVDLAASLNMTLASVRKGRLLAFSVPVRITS